MKVLLTVASVDRAHGGPARSVCFLGHHLGKAGVEVGLWAADGSGAAPELLPQDSGVQRLGGTLDNALERFPEPDLIHDNGLWLPFHHQLAVRGRRRRIPRVVSPRGMLEPWAMDYKRWKKRLAWWAYQKRVLDSAAAFHVTAEPERATVAVRWPGRPLAVIPNGVECVRATPLSEGRGKDVRTALFLGRLHPVKGLPLLLQAWSRVAPTGWRLRIAGPDEAGHRGELETLVSRHGLSESVSFSGAIGEEEKPRVFADADLFILPSHTENFGIACAEAMGHGLPVIATHGAPWKRVADEGCGWWVPVSVDGIAEALSDATGRSAEALREMGLRGRAMAEREFGWTRIAGRMRELYGWVLGGGEKPGSPEGVIQGARAARPFPAQGRLLKR